MSGVSGKGLALLSPVEQVVRAGRLEAALTVRQDA
jgi:hypothetical protein